jgi:hypothetical protein
LRSLLELSKLPVAKGLVRRIYPRLFSIISKPMRLSNLHHRRRGGGMGQIVEKDSERKGRMEST